MVTAYDVDANSLIGKTAEKLKRMKMEKPSFVGLVKTGPHCKRPPEQDTFWHVRCASILRQAYVNDSIGTRRLARHYGGSKRRGVRPERHSSSGGSTIRRAMQQLETAGLLMKGKTGRKLTAKGRALLDSVAKEL